MRGRSSTLHCDGENGFCGTWDLDYYEATVSSVNDIPVTTTERAPGWTSTPDGDDFCPECKPIASPAGSEVRDV